MAGIVIGQPLAEQTHTVLAEIARQLTADEKAQLPTLPLADPPILYWRLLARIPAEQGNNPATEAVWRAVLPALARITPSRRSIGWVLFDTGMSKLQLIRLLSATGPSLVTVLSETVHWLLTRRVAHAALAELALLGLADAVGDREARDAARRDIALAYARAALAKRS